MAAWDEDEAAAAREDVEPFSQWTAGLGKGYSMSMPEQTEQWKHLTPSDIDRGVVMLRAMCKEDRLARMDAILAARTSHVRFVYEHPTNPNNVWAALRTMDAFGIQYVDCIMNKATPKQYKKPKEMVPAIGAQKWLTLTAHATTAACIARLRADGYRIVVTDLSPKARSVGDIDWVSGGPVAIVMGNEERGISDELRAAADEACYIPTRGFAQSLNLSVAAAVMCATLDTKGALHPGLNVAHAKAIQLTWLARTVPSALKILKAAGLDIAGHLYTIVYTPESNAHAINLVLRL
jgi:tRNA (guanosine-2'-O-)-methyltransferase